ncbi:MAG: segregation/condensation protein A [Planctomycetes bacterium]|nr:segregation/condensation protein A [Planctomycetota bacterium]
MTDYRVKLGIYNGPMDLLLYLIRRSEVDINDIPIAKITEQYIQYVNLIKQINLDLAGDFLVMAATLMEIKSAILLPREETPDGQEEDLSDPRLELVRQLLEYKKFKDIAGELSESAVEQAQRYHRSRADLERVRQEKRQEQELDLESVQIWDLFEVFNRLMHATLAGKRKHQIFEDDTPIDIYEADILDRAQKEKPMLFESIFEGRHNRIEMVGLFLALLELIRMKLIRIEQELDFGPIYIIALTDESAELAVAHAVSADIDQLPSEAQKQKPLITNQKDQNDTVPPNQ